MGRTRPTWAEFDPRLLPLIQHTGRAKSPAKSLAKSGKKMAGKGRGDDRLSVAEIAIAIH